MSHPDTAPTLSPPGPPRSAPSLLAERTAQEAPNLRDALATGASLRRQNRRLGLMLAAVAVTFFVGFIAKMVLLRGGHL